MKNTPIDITLSLLRRFSTNTNKNQFLNHRPRHDRMGQKTISHYCPFKCVHISRYCCFLFMNRKTKGPTKLVVIKSGLDVRGYFKICSYLAFHFSLSFRWKQGKLFWLSYYFKVSFQGFIIKVCFSVGHHLQILFLVRWYTYSTPTASRVLILKLFLRDGNKRFLTFLPLNLYC